MNIQNLQNFRDFLVQPLLKGILENRFKPGELVLGKIIQALPKQNLFVLKIKGMNLVATTRLALFAGDRIKGQIIDNQEQIELKLTEVNGKSVQQNLPLRENDIAFSHIPLAEDIFGHGSFLEIYLDQSGNHSSKEDTSSSNYHLIFFNPDLRHIVIDLNLIHGDLTAIMWVEKQDLYQFLENNLSAIEQILVDDFITTAKLHLNPFRGDISHFRQCWTEFNFDIRA